MPTISLTSLEAGEGSVKYTGRMSDLLSLFHLNLSETLLNASILRVLYVPSPSEKRDSLTFTTEFLAKGKSKNK